MCFDDRLLHAEDRRTAVLLIVELFSKAVHAGLYAEVGKHGQRIFLEHGFDLIGHHFGDALIHFKDHVARKAVRDHTRCGTKCSIGVQTGKKADGTPAVQMVEMLFIPEGDVYRLIVHSKLPSAERFERWVFDEVLPSIRQHGAYLTREKLWEVATSPEALLKLCSDLLAEREKNAALREDNAQLQGKAVYYDLFINLRHSTNLRTTAKELDVPERRFVRFLLERRYVYRTPSGCVLPYAKGSNEGLFCVKDFCRNGHTGSYTLVTPKGKLHFAELRSLILVTV